MKVKFGIPTHYSMETPCVLSILATQRLLLSMGIDHEFIIITGCSDVPSARNTIVSMFMKDKDATDLFFIDADIGFNADAILKMLERPEKIVAGCYPTKRDLIVYTAVPKTEDGIPIGRDGLIEADYLATGFMRIKRIAIEKMQNAFPDLKYHASVVRIENSGVKEAYNFFNRDLQLSDNNKYTSEDYSFCARWRSIGGQLWIYPDIDFVHVGTKEYKGNYHKYLIRLKELEGVM